MPTGSLLLDSPQVRVSVDRIAAVVGGKDWSPNHQSGVYVHRSTGTVILLPNPLSDEWATNAAGNFARFRLADYSGITAANWKERLWSDLAGDYVVDLVVDGGNEIVFTPTGLKNAAYYLEWFVHGSGRDSFTQMECGWSDTGDSATGVILRINPGRGCVEIAKNGVLVGRYTLSRPKRHVEDEDDDDDGKKTIAGKPFGIVLIPGFRRNCLLGITTDGGTFCHTFSDLDPEDATIEVVPASKFWWYVREGAATVQCAKVHYPTTGYACSLTAWLGRTPLPEQYAAGSYAVFYDAAGTPGATPVSATMVKRFDDATAYNPVVDGIEARVKVSIASNGNYTPHVYGAQIEYPRVVKTTQGPATELLGAVQNMALDVADGPNNTTLTADLRNPYALLDTGGAPVAGLDVQANRPAIATIDGVHFFAGMAEEPDGSDFWNEEAIDLQIRFADKWKLLERHVYKDPKIFDGYYFSNTTGGEPCFLVDVLTDAGIEASRIDIQDDSYRMTNLPPSGGRWNCEVSRGKSAARAIMDGFNDHAGNWIYGFRPRAGGWQFAAGDEDWYGTVEYDTIYFSVAEARANLPAGLDGRDASNWIRDHVYREFRQKPLPIEANNCTIEGVDLASGRPIIVTRDDLASQNPETAPGARPDNWAGGVLPYGFYSPRIVTLDAGQRTADLMLDRLSKARKVAQWAGQFLRDPATGYPLWRGDVVRLSDHGRYRILSLQMRAKSLRGPGAVAYLDWYDLPTSYTAIRVGD